MRWVSDDGIGWVAVRDDEWTNIRVIEYDEYDEWEWEDHFKQIYT